MTLSALLSLQSYTPLNATSDFPDDHSAEARLWCPRWHPVPVSADTIHAKDRKELVPPRSSAWSDTGDINGTVSFWFLVVTCISQLSSHWDRSLCGQSHKEAACERNDWSEARGVFSFLTGSFREASEVIHGKTEVKILILLKSVGFLSVTPGEPGFLSKILWKKKDHRHPHSAALPTLPSLAAVHLHQLRIWSSVPQGVQAHPAISLHCYSPAWACAGDKERALIPSTLHPIPFTSAEFTFCFVSSRWAYTLINFLLLRLQEHRII